MPRDTARTSVRRQELGLPEIHTQLRIANRLAVAQLRQTVGQQELVRLLAGTGASHLEIADALGTTPATVAVTLQRLKRKSAKESLGEDSVVETITGAEK